MRAHVEQRHERVLELVRERGSIRIAELAVALDMSAVTLRRDVDALVVQGRLERLHGAVIWPAGQGEEPDGTPEAPVIGVIVPTTGSIFTDIVRGVREVVEEHGGRIILGMSAYVDTEDAVQAEHLLAGGAGGLIVAPSWLAGAPVGEQGKWLQECGVPTVLIERSAPPGHPAAELDRVRTDRAYGAGRAVAHFASLGHRRVAAVLQVGPHATHLTAGFLAAVESLGLDPVPDSPALRAPEEYEAMASYLVDAVENKQVTAALVHSDEDAVVLVPRLRAQGIRVPEDLAVIAFDDEVAGLSDTPLTAVAPPKHAVGRAAAELLLLRMAESRDAAEPAPRQYRELLPQLRVRSSCGGARDGSR